MYIVKQFEIKRDREFSVLITKVGYDKWEVGNRSVFVVSVASICCQSFSMAPKVKLYVLTKLADERMIEKRRS
jgi:hypothetical protein